MRKRYHLAGALLFVLALIGALLSILASPAQAAATLCVGPRDVDLDGCHEYWQGLQSQRSEVITHVVESGDTLWAIAARYELDVDTLRYSNPALMRNPDMLSVGTVVRILPFLGAIHMVQPGDSLESIARRWNVSPDIVQGYGPNRIRDGHIEAGQELVIPGGYLELNIPAPGRSSGFTFAWPLRGWLTQGYRSGHLAVDIATSYGATVYAAGDGVVRSAGWLFTGYGYSAIIDHGSGLQTLYSHLKGPLVRVGQRVQRGQAIGAVGSTGRSTGPHVHFEVRRNGVRVNPLDYLSPPPPR